MIASGRLAEHENPGEATVMILRERVRLLAADLSWEGAPRDLLIIPIAPSLQAIEDWAVPTDAGQEVAQIAIRSWIVRDHRLSQCRGVSQGRIPMSQDAQ
jgi:hypothetical protein